METSTRPKIPLILVVDDDPVARLQLRLGLEGEGYQIAEAQDGAEGLALYQQLQPSIVLLDALMPEMDGFECCKALNAIPRETQIPILIITGLNDQQSVDCAFAAGAADYVTKPVHWPVLRQRVRRLIQQTQLQQELEAANRELRRLALVDGLTQVANRRCFDEGLEQSWLQHREEQQPLSLLLCDIDYFKGYNDYYGHQAGDHCLQQVAAMIQSTLNRSTDLVARYGGEEFVVLLPKTTTEGALQVAQQMHHRLTILAIPHYGSRVSTVVTLSIGLATVVPDGGADPQALIRAADEALYEAKHQGRNRHWVYQQPIQDSVWLLGSQLKSGFSPAWTIKCHSGPRQFLSRHHS
jgi:diguanylate cyclase (GGDEF)-like protein